MKQYPESIKEEIREQIAADRSQKEISRKYGISRYSKGVYARVAWILRNSGNGYAYEAMERVVAKKNTNVYLEAVEETENKSDKPKEIGYGRMAGLQKRKHSKRLLGCCEKRYTTSYHNKRMTNLHKE